MQTSLCCLMLGLNLKKEQVKRMEESRTPSLRSNVPESSSSRNSSTFNSDGHGSSNFHGPRFPRPKKRGHAQGSRSWIKIDQSGNSKTLELDKATVMRDCSLPARDICLLDPLFIYRSTILVREKAIVVSLEQIRCIITADEVILINSSDGCMVQYKLELCKRLQTNEDKSDDLPFEFRALELALELTCASLDNQMKELEIKIYPVLDELASSIKTFNLERVRRFKGQLLALTQRVQKVCDEIEHLMIDDGDMAEMYLTKKKQRKEAYTGSDLYDHPNTSSGARMVSKSAPSSPVGSVNGAQKLRRAFSSTSLSSNGSLIDSSSVGENINQLEMLLEAYFVFIDDTLNKLLSFKECIDDTEDLIKIELDNVQNQLMQFKLFLRATVFLTTIWHVVTSIFGMKFPASIFSHASIFNWVLIITGVSCGMLYGPFLIYCRHKKIISL